MVGRWNRGGGTQHRPERGLGPFIRQEWGDPWFEEWKSKGGGGENVDPFVAGARRERGTARNNALKQYR